LRARHTGTTDPATVFLAEFKMVIWTDLLEPPE
jgi:hypothetical protein